MPPSQTRLAAFLSESGCKGTAFSNTLQIFRQLFLRKYESFRVFGQNQKIYVLQRTHILLKNLFDVILITKHCID